MMMMEEPDLSVAPDLARPPDLAKAPDAAEEPDMDETDMDETDMDETDMDETDMDETDMETPDMDETDMDKPDMDETDMDKPDMSEADMNEADLPMGDDMAIDMAVPNPDLTDPRDFTVVPDVSVVPDLVVVPCVDGAACVANGGAKGLCKVGVCSPTCVDITDDAACGKAYPGNICVGGTCVVGNCRKAADCPGTQICGLAAPNTCAKCLNDMQCAMAYGNGSMCNVMTGNCQAPGCNVGDNNKCPGNGGDVCCSAKCVPGECCDDAFCKKSKNDNRYVCNKGTCTLCDAVANNTYMVDPVNGNDLGASGSGTAMGMATATCSFQSITKVLLLLGANPPVGTKILVKGPATITKTESYPIAVPGNVSIVGMGGVTIQVPLNGGGMTFNGPKDSLTGITLDGSMNTALTGIQVNPLGELAIDNTTITAFQRDGIFVTGSIAVGPGVVANSNGTDAVRRAGIHFAGNGMGTINVPAGQAPSTFDKNTGFGIHLEAGGSVQVTGVPTGLDGKGTVTANGNYFGGLYMQQTPSSKPPLSVIDGLVAYGNTPNYGVRLVAGVPVKLRNSVVLSNASHGIFVQRFASGNTIVNDVTMLDLGTANSLGKNTVQAPLGKGQNQGSGICLQLDNNANQILQAQGNVFTAQDCSKMGAAKIVRTINFCGKNADIGTDGANNDINTDFCPN